MQKRSSSKTPDVNVIASNVLVAVTGSKNAAAVELGRLGGLKGGPARAQKLSASRRRSIARKAAKAMWAKRKDVN